MITAKDIREAMEDPLVRNAPALTDEQANTVAVLFSTINLDDAALPGPIC